MERRPGGRLSRDQIRDIADRVNIVDVISSQVTLRKAGGSFKGLCPFHEEKTPSFNVDPRRQMYKCFGCGEGGDIYSFLMKISGMTFVEALEEVARRAGVELPRAETSPEDRRRAKLRNSMYDVNDVAAEFFCRCLRARIGTDAMAYLQRRGMPEDVVQRYGLGFAPDLWDGLVGELRRKNISLEQAERAGLVRERSSGGHYDFFRNRLMIPIRDHRGKVVGFGGRILSNEEPKYFNTPESPVYDKSSTLFGLGEAVDTIRKEERALIVEGYFDVMGLAANGVTNAVASCGTALTPNQLRILKRHTPAIVLVYDGDAAGVDAACRGLDLFLEQGLWPLFIGLPDGMDPDDYIRAHGEAAFRQLLDDAEPLMERFISESVRRHRGKPLSAERVIEEVAPTLLKMSQVTAEPYWGELADRLRVDEGVVRAHARGLRGSRQQPANRAPRKAPSPRASYPANEWALLKHIIHHPLESAPMVSERQIANMMISPLAEMVRMAARDALEGREPDVLRMLDRTEDDHVKKLLTDLSMSEEMIGHDDVDRLLDQLCLNIRRAHLERLRTDARRRARQSKDPQAQQRAAADVIRLSRELASLQADAKGPNDWQGVDRYDM